MLFGDVGSLAALPIPLPARIGKLSTCYREREREERLE
jgi:hypothetical protein